MKRISLRTGARYSSKDVFRLVCEQSPQKALTVSEIRSRVKVLETLDSVHSDTLVLEDAVHATLKAAIDAFPWNVAHADLLAIIDDVTEAKEVSTANLKAVAEQ